MGDTAREPRCQHEGCALPAMLCTCSYAEELCPPGGFVSCDFCPAHAPLHGYCACCGDFWAGITAFEVSGYCEHCLAEIEADAGRGDEDADYSDEDIYP